MAVRTGDLYIVFEVKPSDKFIREGDDIIVNVPLTFAQAALGTEIKVDTVYGQVMLKIPPGTQSESKFRLKGKGAPNIRTKQLGDQYVIVTVVTPQKLNNQQRKVFEDLLRVEDEAAPQKNWWDRFKSNFTRQ